MTCYIFVKNALLATIWHNQTKYMYIRSVYNFAVIFVFFFVVLLSRFCTHTHPCAYVYPGFY